MRTSFQLATVLLACIIALATGPANAAEANISKPIPLLQKIGKLHHSVATTNELAQHYFNQGLTLVYGFNHDAAIRSFKRAAEFDGQLAMAHWGIALALGPNINVDVDPEREKAAYEAAQTALSLAEKAPPEDQAYVHALTNRYSIDPKADLKALAVNYKNAMGELARRYPDDLDAATLYAESAMDLRPWQLWTADGEPAEGTEEIVAVLESVLRRNPNHIGANHYYIHAVEASRHPERALPSAQRLETLVPVAGHLVHMPAHIYIRVGDYAAAARRNEVAAEVDLDYIQSCGVQGIYPMLYYSHNLHFLAVANALQGRFTDANKAAERLVAHVGPAAKQVPDLEVFLPTQLAILVCFHRWDEILKLPEPDPSLKQNKACWHFARGMAYAASGKSAEAAAERRQLLAIKESLPADAKFGPFNRAHDILKIAELQLSAKIALAGKDPKTAIELLETAVPLEDSLRYMEPPDWYLYSREALGAALVSAGEYARAETVYRTDLEKNPRKGRALFGLQAALNAQGKESSAGQVQREFAKAWENADTPLRSDDLW